MIRFVALAVLSSMPLHAQARVLASVVPALAYGTNCSSALRLQNLADRVVAVQIEGHRESGALVGLAGLPGAAVHLAPHERGDYKLDVSEETSGAWANIRETVDSPDLSPAVAISASTDCASGNQLRSSTRSVVYPTRNPWFDGDVTDMRGNVVLLINTSESTARATACYSSGGLYSVPTDSRKAPELLPICISSTGIQIPPFGSRQFPVSRDGSSHLSLKTHGDGIVLEMLKPLEDNLHIYAVDSSIKFGNEAWGEDDVSSQPLSGRPGSTK
jgi:hypothetical protein